jgi:Putative salt-induced outer membrane protein
MINKLLIGFYSSEMKMINFNLCKLSISIMALTISGLVYSSNTLNTLPTTDSTAVSPWKGSNAGLGFVMNTGDTQNNNQNASLNINYKPNTIWTLISKNTFQRSTSNKSGLTAWQLNLSGQANYNITTKNYIYGNADYIDNKFDGYDFRLQDSLGYGHSFNVPENMTLSFQLGPGSQLSRARDTGEKENLITGNLGVDYNWEFTEKSTFTEDLKTVASRQTILLHLNHH